MLKAELDFTSIDRIISGGLHEYLTAFLESTQDLSAQIQRSFFSSTIVE